MDTCSKNVYIKDIFINKHIRHICFCLILKTFQIFIFLKLNLYIEFSKIIYIKKYNTYICKTILENLRIYKLITNNTLILIYKKVPRSLWIHYNIKMFYFIVLISKKKSFIVQQQFISVLLFLMLFILPIFIKLYHKKYLRILLSTIHQKCFNTLCLKYYNVTRIYLFLSNLRIFFIIDQSKLNFKKHIISLSFIYEKKIIYQFCKYLEKYLYS